MMIITIEFCAEIAGLLLMIAYLKPWIHPATTIGLYGVYFYVVQGSFWSTICLQGVIICLAAGFLIHWNCPVHGLYRVECKGCAINSK